MIQMDKTISIIKREFKTKVFTKGFLIGTLIGPIFMIGIALGPAYFFNISEKKAMEIKIVDETGILFNRLAGTFNDTLDNGEARFILIPVDPLNYNENPKDYQQKIEREESSVLLVLPEHLIEGGDITFYSRTVSDIDLIQLIRRRINEDVNKIRLEQAGFDPEKIKKLTSQIGIKTKKMVKGKAEEKGFGQEFFTAFIFLLILYMTILLYGAGVMRSVLEEKTSRIIEVLLSSSNSFNLMMGKIFGVGGAGLVQYGIWTILAFTVFFFISGTSLEIAQHIKISPNVFLAIIVFFVLGFFEFSTLYAAVGAMCSSQEDAQALSTPVTLLIIIPFIISFTVINDPSSTLAQVLSLVPFFTPMLMFLRIILATPPFFEIMLSIVINIVAILIFVWISAKIYRVGILMYGKRPTVPEIIKWIRYK
jgi:ABC-2 type transport system permease protein